MTSVSKKMSAVVTGFLILAALTGSAQSSLSPVKSKNKVAIIPMIYIGDASDERNDEMSYILQDIAVSYMSRSAAELKFMDVAELNALLFKKGITPENIRRYSPKELSELLHVEYVIMGSVVQDKGSVVTVSSQHTTRRQSVDHYNRYGKRGRHSNHVDVIKRNNSNSSTVTRQNVETQVSFAIYNEDGEKIYSKSRQSILSETDAYKNAIHYLLKRTPLYNR